MRRYGVMHDIAMVQTGVVTNTFLRASLYGGYKEALTSRFAVEATVGCVKQINSLHQTELKYGERERERDRTTWVFVAGDDWIGLFRIP